MTKPNKRRRRKTSKSAEPKPPSYDELAQRCDHMHRALVLMLRERGRERFSGEAWNGVPQSAGLRIRGADGQVIVELAAGEMQA